VGTVLRRARPRAQRSPGRPRPQSGLGEHPGRDAHPGGHDSGRRLGERAGTIDRSSHLYERVPAEFW